MTTGPKYPNQQLRSVSLETHFPGELSVYGALGGIQSAVRTELPNLFVPNLQAGEAVALRPFQMRDPEQRRSLAVAVNQVSYVSFDYPGFDAFSAEALPLVSAVLGHIRPAVLNRVTYRYENEVGIARDADGWLVLDHTFPGIVPGLFSGIATRGVNSMHEHAWKDGTFHGSRGFHARLEEERGVTVFKLTVFGSVEAADVTGLAQATGAAHKVSVELFESLISENFRRFIGAAKE